MKFFLLVIFLTACSKISNSPEPEIVHFQNGEINLAGELFKPSGTGPFPAILYNHGSAPGMLNDIASKAIGPLFVKQGWIFFMPYRRGQGLSEKAGKYIGNEIEDSYKIGGENAASKKLVELMETEQLNDQMAAFKWLSEQKFVDSKRLAVQGNSFGGIQTLLAAEKIKFCAAIDAAGGADSWKDSPELRVLLRRTVRNSKTPIYFFQAENDFDLSPSKELTREMKLSGKKFELKIFPRFGASQKDGHSFPYAGANIWFADVFSFIQQNCPPTR
jgi:carboxymethylenebutenolidase